MQPDTFLADNDVAIVQRQVPTGIGLSYTGQGACHGLMSEASAQTLQGLSDRLHRAGEAVNSITVVCQRRVAEQLSC